MDEERGDYVINNAYTNAMTRPTIEVALQAWRCLQTHAPDRAPLRQQLLGIDEPQMKHWQKVVQRLRILQNPEQFEGIFQRAPFGQPTNAERKDSYQDQGMLVQSHTTCEDMVIVVAHWP